MTQPIQQRQVRQIPVSEAERSHVCELCEAGCGLLVEPKSGRVRPDPADVFSRGFVCPKGAALPALVGDPDRLRGPVRRGADGSFQAISWDEAFATIARELKAIQRRHGRDAVATYVGTPVVHKHGSVLMRNALLGTLRTRNSTSAGSQDTTPRFVASYLMYGSAFSVPVPDVDRTAFFLCIGANPLVSNGSLMTAPNMRARLRALRERGGKLVVVDPRLTETAEVADEHISVRPGGDAALVLLMVRELLRSGRADERRIERTAHGFAALKAALLALDVRQLSRHAGIEEATIVRLAHDFADAPSSVAYARMGVCNNEFATLASFAVDLLNLVAGRLGELGGSMFPTPAVPLARLARLSGVDGFARFRSRVRGLPETVGDIPASTLAEEMETAGPGQVRALVTWAGNPVLSTPNGRRLALALEQLDFMVSIDFYVNETSRFADIILPPASPLADDHVDLFFANFAVRDVLRWTPPAEERAPDERCDWEIVLELCERMGGGPTGIRAVDLLYRGARKLGYRFHPSHLLELAMRIGPHGDYFLPWRAGLNGKRARAAEHGVDLGPLRRGLRARVHHRGGKLELFPAAIQRALQELVTTCDRAPDVHELLLIGRRDLSSNNSWMHNLPRLVAGRERCVLFVHPLDAQRAGLTDGDTALMESRTHRGSVPVKITDSVREGVVSLPHGFGHAGIAPFQRVAAAHPGVSINDWTDDQAVESVVGQSILNGVPVRLRPASA
ncbi:MAG: molybdopterin-dependent oxidoreductase [Myxococcales bacterium]